MILLGSIGIPLASQLTFSPQKRKMARQAKDEGRHRCQPYPTIVL